jgi:hypothetical protein
MSIRWVRSLLRTLARKAETFFVQRGDEAPSIALWFKDRHDFDYDDAVICLVHSLLREAQQASERSPEAYFVLEFIGRSIYGLGDGDSDSSESS